MGKLISAVYNGFIWACMFTLLCVRSVVICMHVNIGVLFMISLLFFSIVTGLIFIVKNKRMGAKASLLNLCVCSLAVFGIYKFIYHQSLLRKLPFAVRLALNDSTIRAQSVMTVFLIILAGGYIGVVLAGYHTEAKNIKKTL